MMNQRFDYIKREKSQYTHYLVVVESSGRGYIIAITPSAKGAEWLARRIINSLSNSSNDDIGINDVLSPYQIIQEYDIKRNAGFITSYVWADFYGLSEVYVVGVCLSDGGINRFVHERQHYSELLSVHYLLIKYEKINSIFKEFPLGAN